MNYSRLALAAIVAWVASLVIGYAVNTYLLAEIYAAHAFLFRPESEMNLSLGFGVQLLGFFVFAYMYAKGYEGTNELQEGLRFGVLVGLLFICFALVWTYVVQPVSARLAAYWIVDSLVEMAIYGTIVGSIYRPRAVAVK
jgi:hypothetical protein